MSKLVYGVVGYGTTGKNVLPVLNEMRRSYRVIERGTWANKDALDEVLPCVDAAIVFVSPDSGYEVTRHLLERGIDTVVGTTKFYSNPDGTEKQEMFDEFRRLALATNSRMGYGSNFSTGVNLVWKVLKPLAREMAAEDYRPVIAEVHHTGKTKDVSATAKTCGKILLDAYGGSYDGLEFDDDITKAVWVDYHNPPFAPFDYNLLAAVYCDGRVRDDTSLQAIDIVERVRRANPSKIPIIPIRSGNIPGTHFVYFLRDNHTTLLANVIKDRKEFAEGGVDFADWLQDKKPGVYNISEMFI